MTDRSPPRFDPQGPWTFCLPGPAVPPDPAPAETRAWIDFFSAAALPSAQVDEAA